MCNVIDQIFFLWFVGSEKPCIYSVPNRKQSYLDYVTTSDVGRSYFDYTAKKTTNLASTNSTTILQFRLPVPPIEEQQKIVQYLKEKVDELNQMLTKHLALIDKLTEYKKSLIYEAVTGKKEV